MSARSGRQEQQPIPGDAELLFLFRRELPQSTRPATNDYVATAGLRASVQCYYKVLNGCVDQKSQDGVLSGEESNFTLSIEKISDGTSTTILTGELAGRPDSVAGGVKKVVPTNLINTGQANYGGCWSCFDNAENWIEGSTFDGAAKVSVKGQPVCVINCTNESGFGLYSFHPRVVRGRHVRRIGAYGERESQPDGFRPTHHL